MEHGRTALKRKERPTASPRLSLSAMAALVAFAGACAMMLPAFGSLFGDSWPGFMQIADVRYVYFPQFVQGYFRFWNGGQHGIDFFTHGGATSWSMRVNLGTNYPVYLLSYLLFDLANLRIAKAIFVLIHGLHVFVAIFFAICLGRRFLGLSRGASVLFALSYGLSSAASTQLVQTFFFYQAMLVPMLAYVFCYLLFVRRLPWIIIGAAPVVIYMLTNYPPMMLAGLICAYAVAVFVAYVRIGRYLGVRTALRRLAFPTASALIAAGFAAPFYVAEFLYFKSVAEPKNSLADVAHSAAMTYTDLLLGFTTHLKSSGASEVYLYWGLIPAAILLIAFLKLAVEPMRHRRFLISALWGSLAIHGFVLLLAIGKSTILSDIFYYAVPVLGRMHIYERYVLFSQLFWSLAIAIAATVVMTNATERQRLLILVFGLGTGVALVAWLLGSPSALVKPDRVLPEIVFFMAAIVILAFGRTSASIGALAIPICLVSLSAGYQYQREPLSYQNVASQPHIDHSAQTVNRLVTLLTPADPAIVLPKVLNLSDSVDSFFPYNYSWLTSWKRKFVNFGGYDSVLAMDQDYLDMMGGWYGRFNREWVLRTGVDFVIWDDASAWKLKLLTVDTVSVDQTHPIGGGQYLSALRYGFKPHIGQDGVLLAMKESDPASWNVSAQRGWTLKGGRMVRLLDATINNFGIVLKRQAGTAYAVEIEVVDSTRGSVNIAFCGKHAAPVAPDGPGKHVRRFDGCDSKNDLWFSSSADFDGAITNIVVRQLSEGLPAPMTSLADNGIVRLEGSPGGAQLTDFQTNWTNRVTAKVTAGAPARLVWLLWPNRYMQPYLNGRPINWTIVPGWPAYLDLPPGDHVFELRFESGWSSVFRVGMLMLALMVVAALAMLRFRN